MADVKQIERVAVVGTGVIGASWAAFFLARGLHVAATDPTANGEETLYTLLDRVWPQLAAAGLAPGASKDRLIFSRNMAEALEGVAWVQENGPERMELKQKLFADMDRLTAPNVILATSSSGLSMSEIQIDCENPERCVTGHPLNPPHLIPVVEVVGGKRTSEQTLAAAMRFYKEVGKRPIQLLKEVGGHVSNRLQAAIWRECVSLVADGVISVADIDEVMCRGLGPRWAVMGPNLLFHLGGGRGGLDQFMEHLGVHFSAWLNDLGKPELTPEIRSVLVAGVQEQTQGYSVQELEARRDRMLTAVLGIEGRIDSADEVSTSTVSGTLTEQGLNP